MTDRTRLLLSGTAVVAMVAALLAGSIWATHGEDTGHKPSTSPARVRAEQPPRPAPPACPSRYRQNAPWVPAQQTGFNRRSRLVPRQAPSAAVLCRYLPSARYRLSGVRPVRAGLDRLGADLTWMPRDLLKTGQHACTLVYKPPVHYLIRLSYRDGTTLWVSSTDDINNCTNTSNGDFRSWNELSSQLTGAFGSGRWPRRPAPSCNEGGNGRRGQERAMVPAGSVTVRICGADGRGRTLTSGYGRLVDAFDRLPGRPWGLACSPTHRLQPAPSYDLLFSYPQGPDVAVSVMSWCRPEINNLSLQSESAATVLPIIGQLLAGRTP